MSERGFEVHESKLDFSKVNTNELQTLVVRDLDTYELKCVRALIGSEPSLKREEGWAELIVKVGEKSEKFGPRLKIKVLEELEEEKAITRGRGAVGEKGDYFWGVPTKVHDEKIKQMMVILQTRAGRKPTLKEEAKGD